MICTLLAIALLKNLLYLAELERRSREITAQLGCKGSRGKAGEGAANEG